MLCFHFVYTSASQASTAQPHLAPLRSCLASLLFCSSLFAQMYFILCIFSKSFNLKMKATNPKAKEEEQKDCTVLFTSLEGGSL